MDKAQSKFKEGRKGAEQFATACNSIKTGAEQAGKGAEKGASGLSKFGKSILRIAKYRMIRSVIRNIISAFSEGLQNVRDYSDGLQGEGRRIADAFNNMSTHTLTMKNQIGSAFAEILVHLMPVVEQIVSLLTRAANVIAQFFAALGGNGKYYKAVDATAQVAKNLGGGAKSAKEIRNTLMGFDVINRLDAPQEPSGGGGGGTANKNNNMFEYTDISKKLTDNLAAIELAAGGFLLGLGLVLLFSGANMPLGLGLIAAGAVLLAKSVQANWDAVPPKVQYAVAGIMTILGGALFAIGAVFMLTGHFGLGLGLMIAGMVSVGAVAANFNNLTSEVQKAIISLMQVVSVALIALGFVFLLTGHFGIGLAMILAGGALGFTAMALNWNALPDKVKEVWKGIKDWWDTHVKKYFTKEYWQDLVDKMFDVDAHIKMPVIEWVSQPVWDWLAPVMDFFGLPPVIPVPNVVWQSFATGGFPEDGLFMANHGELVGQFSNGNTAVANNEQIIAGIERGVYNAMTSALAGQNNSNRDIRVYLDGKEIGAATRKYERNMNRATGVALG